MSTSKEFFPRIHRNGPEVIGPYSPWPRRSQKRPVRTYFVAGSTAAIAATFVHCVAPLI